MKKQTLSLIFLLATLLLIPVKTAAAHANIDRSLPAADAVLDQPPTEVTIWFTEPVEEEFSEIMVFAADRTRVDNGDSHLLADDPMAVVVSLRQEPPLAEGTYTVSWKNVSTVDGHIVRSSFVFSIGQSTVSEGLETAEPAQTTSPLEPIIRWLILLSIAGIVGGLTFDLFVMRPSLAKFKSDIPAPHTQILSGRILKLIWLFMLVFLAASLAQLFLQAGNVSGERFPALIGQPTLTLLTNTYWGNVWLGRMASYLLLVVLLLARRSNSEVLVGQSWKRPRQIAMLLTGTAIMLALSLVSHAFATIEIRITAVISDFLHLAAASIWAGGLFHFACNASYLLKNLPQESHRQFMASFVSRFSVLAASSVAVLILTGLFSSYAQVTAVSALNTPYGRILLVKLALITPLLALGAVNLFYLSRRLSQNFGAGLQLGRTVWTETLIIILVLLTVGFLITMEPARQVYSRENVEPEEVDSRLRLESMVDRLTGTVIVDAAEVGDKVVRVELSDANGRPVENASDVILTVTFPAEDLQPFVGRPRSLGGGVFEFDEVAFTLAGLWQANLLVVRPTAFDTRLSYEFEVGGGAESETAAVESNALVPQPSTAVWLFALMLLGLIIAGAIIYSRLVRRVD